MNRWLVLHQQGQRHLGSRSRQHAIAELARQIQFDRGTLSDLAINLYMAARLSDESVDLT